MWLKTHLRIKLYLRPTTYKSRSSSRSRKCRALSVTETVLSGEMSDKMNSSSRRRHASVGEFPTTTRKPPPLRRADSWAPSTYKPGQTTSFPSARETLNTKTVTPLVPHHPPRPASLPVTQRHLSLPIIQPKHEKLQKDFYKLQQSLRVLAREEERRTEGKTTRTVRQDKYNDPPTSPFENYLQRLKLKEELPWRGETAQRHKKKSAKVKNRDRKVYFHMDINWLGL